ncbi:Hypothetical protein R9X50_00221400 [Acrodontium crateriforme]|uniref:Bis(5'-adenosyl)-triphosphatase n=1 Tax=Acrodontium crateriforme TaxID=150365 RepID=A0AAQ3R8D9_9PEZI|nr:Hypothetical protein R9X50_00221400 [Acrodontium crateriforme]
MTTIKDLSEEMPSFPGRAIKFANFNVTSQVFHVTPHSFALVNLKPLLPGHILVSPLRVVPRLSDLSAAETTDLFLTTTKLQRTLARVYKAEAFNVAVQDGQAAGQSVPHVHVHVIPRKSGDGGEGDKVHEWLEGEEGDVGAHQRQAVERQRAKEEWVKDEDRKPRSKEVMEAEAKWLREEIEKDEKSSAGRL